MPTRPLAPCHLGAWGGAGREGPRDGRQRTSQPHAVLADARLSRPGLPEVHGPTSGSIHRALGPCVRLLLSPLNKRYADWIWRCGRVERADQSELGVLAGPLGGGGAARGPRRLAHLGRWRLCFFGGARRVPWGPLGEGPPFRWR